MYLRRSHDRSRSGSSDSEITAEKEPMIAASNTPLPPLPTSRRRLEHSPLDQLSSRRRRSAPLIVGAALVLVFSLSLLRWLSPQSHAGQRCEIGTFTELRRHASSWTVSRGLNLKPWQHEETFVVEPLVPSACTHSLSPVFDQARFSARLVQRSESTGNVTHLKVLDAPWFHASSSHYTLAVPRTDASLPSGEYQLEVRLELGYLPKPVGQPCQTWSCDERGLNLTYSGQIVEPVYRVSITHSPATLPTSMSSESCPPQYMAVGAWVERSFVPSFPSCVFPTAATVADQLESVLPEGNATWLHFIGDSVTRRQYKKVALLLGIDFLAHTAPNSPGGHPTSFFGMRDINGRRIVITYSWWYRDYLPWHANPLDDIADIEDLKLRLLYPSTIDSIFPFTPLNRPLDLPSSFPRGGPDQVLLSFGSHSSSITLKGVRLHWSKLLPVILSTFGRISTSDRSSLRDPSRLAIITTTPVNAVAIPPRQAFVNQAAMRNNPTIDARNALIRRFAAAESFPVLDWFALLDGTEWDWYEDAVHPLQGPLDAGAKDQAAMAVGLFVQLERERRQRALVAEAGPGLADGARGA